jgi:predicted nucleic acid-binding Zn finger protein
MHSAYQLENELMNGAYEELKKNHVISRELNDRLLKVLGERFTNGMELVDSRKVKRYEFRPSKRIVWVVQGRRSKYQVIPEIPFCYCDDYYFRVMDKKRGLCYHIIAQKIAEATNQCEKISRKDSQYSTITSAWHV